jgi:RNA polymerase sigma-70 factor (ECF subfamily)
MAFVQLYRKYYDAIFRYCVHRLFDRHTAEDITSDVFLKAAQSIACFKGTNEPQFRNWLYRIATNAVNDYLRKVNRRNDLHERCCERTDEQSTTYDESAEQDLTLLRQAMFSLKLKYQTVITLHFFENMKVIEVAEVIGCSPGTARSRLARALAKLRKRLTAAGYVP